MSAIRPLLPADAPEWLRMRAALWPHALDEHGPAIAGFLADPGAPPDPTLQAVLVCPRPTRGLCGFVELGVRNYAEGCASDRVAYVEGWYVDADQRGRGVGRLLIAAAEAWARAQGCDELASDAELANLASQAAHIRLGFTEVGRSVNFRKALAGEG